MSMIHIKDLTFAYDGSYDNIFENASFRLDTDWKIGFVGRNGRGKTTFLRLLNGEHHYTGTISASVEFDYFPFIIENPQENSLDVAEKIFPQLEFWMLCRELNLLEVDGDVLYRPFSSLSKGEQTKVLLAVLFLRENHFLLIDEPTNHLDLEGRAVVARYLKHKKGFILVSHDRAFLDECIDHVISINKSDIQVQQGNYSSWATNMKNQEQFELAENSRLKKEISRLKEAARQTAQWSDAVEKTKNGTKLSGLKPDKGYIGHKAAKMMKRSKNLIDRQEAALEETWKLLHNVEISMPLKIKNMPFHSHRIITGSQVSAYYENSERKDMKEGPYIPKAVFEPCSFTISQGQRIAIRGRNGAGKSSLLQLIITEIQKNGGSDGSRAINADQCFDGSSLSQKELYHTGQLEISRNLKFSYVPQDFSFLSGNLRAFAQQAGIDESLFKSILIKLGFTRGQFEKNMEAFSAGQKKKVLLAKSLSQEAHVFLWDEPLNYVDILSRIQIENLILEFQPTMILIEHDKNFIEKVATDVIELDN